MPAYRGHGATSPPSPRLGSGNRHRLLRPTLTTTPAKCIEPLRMSTLLQSATTLYLWRLRQCFPYECHWADGTNVLRRPGIAPEGSSLPQRTPIARQFRPAIPQTPISGGPLFVNRCRGERDELLVYPRLLRYTSLGREQYAVQR